VTSGNFYLLSTMASARNAAVCCVWVAVVAACVHPAASAPVAPATMLPLMGWSTWNTFQCFINESLIVEAVHALANSPLLAAGYNYVLIDDCWTACNDVDPSDGVLAVLCCASALAAAQHRGVVMVFFLAGTCNEPAPRDSHGDIVVSASKFPNGFLPITTLAHSLGVKVGIYTSGVFPPCVSPPVFS
jgi:hypothetical protein